MPNAFRSRAVHPVLPAFAVAAGLGLFANAALAQASKERATDVSRTPPVHEKAKASVDDGWAGIRGRLENAGVDLTLNYTGEAYDVVSGGLDRGATYEGLLEFSADLDFEKLLGWQGGSGHFTLFQIHDADNRNVLDNVGSLADPSNIDALPATRLYTAWLQQEFAGGSSIRVGQLVADGDFIAAPTADGLLDGAFGWPVLDAANLPNGGPAYPLASPGVRVLLQPTPTLSILSAVFSGDPVRYGCTNDPQICNGNGLDFSFDGGALLISELRYETNQDANSDGLATSYKIGGWYHTGRFADLRFGYDATGAVVPLAGQTATEPLFYRGSWAIYATADQMLWRSGVRSLSVFGRAQVSPQRNLVSWYVDGGIGVKGVIANRDSDVLTFGAAYSRIGRDAVASDRDASVISGSYPIRDAEAVFELSYKAQISSNWLIQPDMQYIVHPGGNVPDPAKPGSAVGNAFIVGLRSSLQF